MPRQYRKAPLVEALCEVAFKGREPWDWTVPGLLYERVKADFPVKRQAQSVDVVVESSAGIHQQVRQYMQFLRQDETALIQIRPDLLAIHHLPPYPGWDSFKQLILDQMDHYRHTVNPEAITSIALRYINRIEIEAERIALDDYFMSVPLLPDPIPQIFQDFVFQTNIPYEAPPSVMRFVFGTVPQNQELGKLGFLLDLRMASLEGNDLMAEEVSDWIESAHMHIETAFDSVLTEKTHKEVLEEVIHAAS